MADRLGTAVAGEPVPEVVALESQGGAGEDGMVMAHSSIGRLAKVTE